MTNPLVKVNLYIIVVFFVFILADCAIDIDEEAHDAFADDARAFLFTAIEFTTKPTPSPEAACHRQPENKKRDPISEPTQSAFDMFQGNAFMSLNNMKKHPIFHPVERNSDVTTPTPTVTVVEPTARYDRHYNTAYNPQYKYYGSDDDDDVHVDEERRNDVAKKENEEEEEDIYNTRPFEFLNRHRKHPTYRPINRKVQ